MNDVRDRLESAGQGHLLRLEPTLDDEARARFRDDLAGIDLDLLDHLVETMRKPAGGKAASLEPAPSIVKGADAAADARARARGRELLDAGKVAVFVVAGGQGSRLGYDGPKGCFPATPVREKPLFQVFAEKLLALRARHGADIPWYVLTSRTNRAQTTAFFEENDRFGLPEDALFFLCQDMLPAVDEDGKILLTAPGELFLSPNGHGGSLLALAKSGALADMKRRGVEHVFYFQVDNPLLALADPVFMGYHDLEGAEMSSKVVPKREASEKVGVLGLVDGRYGVIEYSDLSPEELAAKDERGSLRFNDGNIAVHAFRRDFVEQLTDGGLNLPYHVARKGIPCIDPESGEPRTVAGIKFETFVFDALAECSRSVVLSVDRAEEFSPIKNAEGQDSPETSKAAQSALHRRWLAEAGVDVPESTVVEIAPGYADDAEELKRRAPSGLDTSRPIYLG